MQRRQMGLGMLVAWVVTGLSSGLAPVASSTGQSWDHYNSCFLLSLSKALTITGTRHYEYAIDQR